MTDHYRGAPGPCNCVVCRPHLRGQPVPLPSVDPVAPDSAVATQTGNVVPFVPRQQRLGQHCTDEERRQKVWATKAAVDDALSRFS